MRLQLRPVAAAAGHGAVTERNGRPACLVWREKTCAASSGVTPFIRTHAYRRRHVRHGVRAVAGRRQQAAGGAPRRAAGAPAAGRQPGPHRGGVHAAPRRAVPAQGGARALRRLPPPHRLLDHPRRALLLLDGRLPPVRAAQGTRSYCVPSPCRPSVHPRRTEPLFSLACRS